MSFTHLQVRSGNSLFNSTITTDKLVKHAKQKQFDAIALTDEHVLYGTVPFYKACLKEGIKPIIGMIVYTKDDSDHGASIVLLAKNNTGYRQLRLLSTYLQENRLPHIHPEELAVYLEGLIGVLLPAGSPLEERLLSDTHENVDAYVARWRSLFTEGDFYIGITDHGQDTERKMQTSLKAYQETYKTSVVAMCDVRYLEPSDDVAYDCLQAMKKGVHWKEQAASPSWSGRHLRTSTEMDDVFASFWPEVLHESENIRDKCDVTLSFDQHLLPHYPVPAAMNAHSYLEKICWKNIEKRYTDVTEEVASRLRYELDVIQSMAYSDYFLIVWDFIMYAKQQNISVGPGRGSSASSIVAYVLGITDVDPMKYQLLFERFLNPERVTMPDIDVDFSDTRRDEVIQYVQQKYGRRHVAQIITFGTYQARSLVRDLIKTMGIDEREANFLLKHIPQQEDRSIAQLVQASSELKNYIETSDSLKTLFTIAHKLEGLPKNVSTHAAGVVICDDPLVEHVPLEAGSNNIPITQYPMNDLETIGLLKMDFLGLRNLTLLEHIQASIRHEEGKVISLNAIPEGDVKTFTLLQKGKTNGVFQLESKGMKNVLTRLKPTRFDDIVAVNALYRPGPMNFIPVYIERKKAVKQTTYPHPDLEPILKNTYGVLVYQEQIMLIAHEIAGFRFGEADILRRAVSKKNYDMMENEKKNFIKGCLENGYSKQVAEEIFAWIVKFSNYGFPRSHAVAYSKIAYQLSFLKAHYPASFYSELLSRTANDWEKLRAYMHEIKSLHIAVYAPSINESFGKYTVEKGAIRMGFLAIKGIGYQVVSAIVQERKNGSFKSLFDFCLRMSPKILNRKMMELLIMAGTFDKHHSNRASLLASLDQAMEQGELFREFYGQPDLFQDKIALETRYTDIEDFGQMRRLADEKELFGFYISSHPLADYRRDLKQNGYICMDESPQKVGKQNIKSAAVIQAMKVIRTKRGDPMAFITLSDETDEMEAVIFPDLYRKVNRFLEEETIIMITGKIEARNNGLQWLLSDIQLFSDQSLPEKRSRQAERLFIRYPKKEHAQNLQVIKTIAGAYPGKTPIIIYHQEVKETYQLHSSYSMSANENCLRELKKTFGEANVALDE